jgi:hypothetical protein
LAEAGYINDCLMNRRRLFDKSIIVSAGVLELLEVNFNSGVIGGDFVAE